MIALASHPVPFANQSEEAEQGGCQPQVSSYSLHFGDMALSAFCPVSPGDSESEPHLVLSSLSRHPVLSSLVLVCWAWSGKFQVLPTSGGRLLPCARFHG